MKATRLVAWGRMAAFGLAALCLLGSLAACRKGGADDSAESFIPAPPPSSQAQPASSAPPQEPQPQKPEALPQPPAGISPLTGLAVDGLEEGSRPVSVMVVNNQQAYPQRGLAKADVLVEMLTEGGITRLMALYSDYRSLPQVGPVRSSRDQHVQFALPLNAIQVQIGTSVYARNLQQLMELKVVDGLPLGSSAFWFDRGRSLNGMLNEYCWFTDASLLWEGMTLLDVATTGRTPSLFLFDDKEAKADTAAYRIAVEYSNSASSVFTLNEKTGRYRKSAFGKAHKDENNKRLAYENVLILYCDITMKLDGVCTEFDMRGGEGYYFNLGRQVPITWVKGAPEDPLLLYDAEGEMLQVQKGKSYIGFLPTAKEDGLSVKTKAEQEK